MKQMETELEQKLEQFLQTYEQDLLRLTEEMRNEPLPKLTEELFALFEQTGDRSRYQAAYFGRRLFLSVYGTAACLYGRGEDLAKLESVIDEVCEEECWALPAHVDRAKDKDWRIAVDLFAAETGQTLAQLYHVLGLKLSETIRTKIRREVFRRVLTPFLQSPVPYPRWEHNFSNWNSVCGGCVGSAAIWLMEDETEKRACVERILASLESHYLKGLGDDGACMEGLGYWTYGFAYYVYFADAVKRDLDGDVDLLKWETDEFRQSLAKQSGVQQTGSKIAGAKMAGADRTDTEKTDTQVSPTLAEKLKRVALFQQACYFPHGRTVSFSDGNRRGTYQMGLTAWLAMNYVDESGESLIRLPDPSYAETLQKTDCWRFAHIYHSILWTRELLGVVRCGKLRVRGLDGSLGQTTLEDAQWAICRGVGDVSVAIKGGVNDEPHNHNDAGSFLYLVGEDEVFCDLGSGEYTRDYFSENRYTIFCNGSQSHNVPIVDHGYQKEGSSCGCSRFVTDGQGRVEMEFAAAYGNPKLEKLEREIRFNGADGSLKITDTFVLRENCSLRENFVTQLPVSIEGNLVTLQGQSAVVQMHVSGIAGEITLQKQEHRNHSGECESVTQIQWDVPVENGWARAEIEVKIVPLGDPVI
ncbi:MAG: heparinase II/III family protein [Lachnospiraceae bacterium]|nr:heparinase II/III family protein [Lachnospiraceae bacterium]